jgi:signal transduction histidine kinase/ActR/RegA family two-component response regulator
MPNPTPPMKDRKVRRRIDYSAARTSVSGVLAALVVFVVLASVGGLYRDQETLTLAFGLAIIITAIYRLFLFARFDSLHGAAPGRWRRMFGFGLLLHALVWGVLLAVIVMLYGPAFNFLLICVYVIGVATALGTSWMAALRVRQGYALLMLVPVIITLVLQQNIEGLTLAGLLSTYLLYLMRLYREQYLAFWHVFNRERRVPVESVPVVRMPSGQIQLSLVYRLAHEIRTPMNSIMGMLSLLRETRMDEEQREYHLHANQSGKLLLTLIDDVLDYSRVLTHRISLNPDWFDLRVALEESLDAYGAAAQHAGLELSLVIDRHLPQRLRGDRERLMQIINNLISNAIKFSDQGEICLEISFSALSDEDGMLHVSVRDQGAGMDAETLSGLFRDELLENDDQDLFTARRTGFGLLVCKGLAEAMAGSIHADSQLGQGSRFWFSARLGMQPDMQSRDKLRTVMAGRPVLVVGAMPGQSAGLVEEIEALDINCLTASDYDHALQALRGGLREHTNFSVLFVDTRGRRESALNLARTVLDDPKLSSLRVVLLTTVAERAEPLLQQLVQHYPSRLDVLVKPAHRRLVRESLQRLFEVESTRPAEERRGASEPDRIGRRRWRLLLVEDNEINQIVTRGMLDKLGYQVKTVGEGRSALNLLEREQFDLILMDCMMPEVDGFETTRVIRERETETGRHVPIVAMTANTMEGAEARCLAAGMDDYLAKPVHLEDLEATLSHWLHVDDVDPDEEENTP